ncbi:hypothetical protein THAOC_32297, partial [Thalassiosira oceanica]
MDTMKLPAGFPRRQAHNQNLPESDEPLLPVHPSLLGPSAGYCMTKGIVYHHGLLRNYFAQNSNESDYIHMAVLLLRRLVARGWDRTYIKSLSNPDS